LTGASDHIVSEALYLDDPEGNGIEVYVDRPMSKWLDGSGRIQMSTDRLDTNDLLISATLDGWHTFPPKGRIGHVHLQVGDIDIADHFYCDVLGFASTVDYPGARFYGSGGYHHQLAGNSWNSGGARRRPEGMAGLDAVGLNVKEKANLDEITAKARAMGVESIISDENVTLRDPWGTSIAMTT
jgi:catechol 2,3-dioxygenase